ncbi:MAG: hypothetical protein ABI823_11280 [Bryobacteraceae bacterium]
MDTRSKIISAADATPFLNADSVIVRGTFDPLLASHAADLTAAARPGQNLVVVIEAGSGPILPVRARAELVAGVRAVDYVVPLEAGESVAAPAKDLVAVHEERLNDLIEHVRRRAE